MIDPKDLMIAALRKRIDELEVRLGYKGEGGINICEGIPSHIYVDIGRGNYDDELYDLARDTADEVRARTRIEMEQLRAIISRLPKTEDGQPIIPGMSIWMALPNGPHEMKNVSGATTNEDGTLRTVFFADGFTRLLAPVYSTCHEAQRASKEAERLVETEKP